MVKQILGSENFERDFHSELHFASKYTLLLDVCVGLNPLSSGASRECNFGKTSHARLD